MIDNFLEWFWDRIRDFGAFLKEAVVKANDMFFNILAWIVLIVLIILLFPIWILPFIYWFAFVRNKKGDKT